MASAGVFMSWTVSDAHPARPPRSPGCNLRNQPQTVVVVAVLFRVGGVSALKFSGRATPARVAASWEEKAGNRRFAAMAAPGRAIRVIRGKGGEQRRRFHGRPHRPNSGPREEPADVILCIREDVCGIRKHPRPKSNPSRDQPVRSIRLQPGGSLAVRQRTRPPVACRNRQGSMASHSAQPSLPTTGHRQEFGLCGHSG